jgi:hypothetical protein
MKVEPGDKRRGSCNRPDEPSGCVNSVNGSDSGEKSEMLGKFEKIKLNRSSGEWLIYSKYFNPFAYFKSKYVENN